MAGSEYYDHTTYPSQGSAGSSAAMRSELGSVENGFGKLPGLAGNGGKIVVVNAGGTALEATSTPDLGAATGTSFNGVTITPVAAAVLTLFNGSTLATSGAFSLTLTATAATNITLPTTGTLATLAGTETLTNKTLTSPEISAPTGITATNISNTPAGGITESTAQGALDGLEARKSTYHHNDIINENFAIAQAGTSFAAPANGAYDLDGWANLNTSAAVFTVAQVAGSTAGRFARQVTITTADATVAAGDYVFDSTAIEGYNIEKYVGNTFTVAFRAKVPVAGIHCVALRNSGNDRSYVKEINFPSANVWQDCSFTVVGGLPTAGTWKYTNGTGLKVNFARMVGATFQTTPDAWQDGNFLATANQVNDCATVNNVWALEKVTLNPGTVAAVSEIDVGNEIVRCQRYYETGREWLQGDGAAGAGVGAMVNYRTLKNAAAVRSFSSISYNNGSTLTDQSSSFAETITGFAYNFAVTAAGVGYVNFNWAASARLSHA